VIPRGRPDISWSDLALAAGDALRQQPVPPLGVWPGAPQALACRSVRSGLDLLLRALRLPPGDVLVSAVNIPGMFAVLQAHGLTPIPIFHEALTLSMRTADLDHAYTSRTRLVLIAHLFGARSPLDDLLAWARTHHLPVIEDCAQAFCGPTWSGHPRCLASLFSFGSIKTSTAMGGGVMHLRDRRLLAACFDLQQRDRIPVPGARLRRVGLACLLRVVTIPFIYGAIARWLSWHGRSLDDWVRQRIRGFPDDAVERLREQPGPGLIRTLRRRLYGFNSRALFARWRGARSILALLPSTALCPSRHAPAHTWWCLPVALNDADAAVMALSRHGIDATRRGSALVARGNGGSDSLDARLLERIVYLPMRGLTALHRQRIAAVAAIDSRR